MRILAIDTASSGASAAIAEEGGLLASFALNTGKAHSPDFLPMLEAMLCHAQAPLKEMSALAVTVGPGSFTGLRIGLATVKAWGQALDLPIIPITTLRALACSADAEGLICPVLNAKKDEVYCNLFRGREQVWPDLALPPLRLAGDLAALGEKIIFIGDGWPIYRQLFTEKLGEKAKSVSVERMFSAAGAAAVLAVEEFLAGRFVSAAELEPLYLRLSEAEARKT
ncbi:MAG: tRNA (adenosine(37)-N6)-threonylcarbamoyltransferase complex dimerization subunit type 1 TsaB [Clostridiales bacterium]|nr:tRNA (adenosine(37)-N6)-threonylcarbamoyltransferase complex dimerization subunit type 1 TsaB [Clostridiales bacterium]